VQAGWAAGEERRPRVGSWAGEAGGPRARGKKRKEREGRGQLGRGEKKGDRRRRWAGWAGPKEEKRDGERGKNKTIAFKFENEI
jgi:hypothetical protein